MVPQEPVLLTERLRLRPPLDSDLEPFALMSADTEVMRHIALGRPFDRGTAELAFAVLRQSWSHGPSLFTVEDRESGEYLGFAGTATVALGSTFAGETEIGWRLRRSAWGRGVATEAGTAVRDHAIGQMRRTRLVGLIRPGNHASMRTAAKVGLVEVGNGRGARGEAVLLYRYDPPAP